MLRVDPLGGSHAPPVALVLLLLGPTFVPAADPPDAAKADAEVKGVIGHVGSCDDRPGNTLASLRGAAETGAHVSEMNVRTIRGGVLVWTHDDTADRTTDGKRKKLGKTTPIPGTRGSCSPGRI
jgi:hypothetical protein